jgi:hypothetical protein
MDALAQERTSNNAGAACDAVAKMWWKRARKVSTCATAAAYAPLCPWRCAHSSAVILQDTGGGRPEADRRVRRGTALPEAVLDGRVRAGAEQRGDCVGVALVGSDVQRRPPAGGGGMGGGTGPCRPAADSAPQPTRRTKGPT